MTRRWLSGVLLLGVMACVPRAAFAQFGLQVVASDLLQPLAFVQMPGDATTQLVVEQGGLIRRVTAGVLQPDPYLDLSPVVQSGGELGLLGLAFSPNYAYDGRVFVNYIDAGGNTVVARFTCTSDLWHADIETRHDFIWPGGLPYIVQPSPNHKGGNMAFGPDGFLYIGLGDGGPGDDPDHRAQDPLSLLGKMLRVDAAVADDDVEGYDVPGGNPFAGREDVLDLIWAFGFRNPWRWSFDDPALGGTGALIIGDVGQDGWEEVDYEPTGAGGRNYGWRNREGAHDYLTDLPPFGDVLTDPIFEYDHSTGRAITGGTVYHGQALDPAFRGRYFVGDFVTGRFWALGLSVDPNTGEATLADALEVGGLSGSVHTSAFGVDAAGELYLVSHGLGTVFRVVMGSGIAPTGCTTPDPFASMGGGSCVDGAWLPPGMGGSGGSSNTPPPDSNPGTPPASDSSCTTPDPFASMGGGVCANGGWSPPWSGSSGGSTPPPDNSTPPPGNSTPPPPPASDSSCTTPDPFASMGGGVCANGGWSPPGSTPASTPPPDNSTPPSTPPTTPPSSDSSCQTPDPFTNMGGGVCANGGWLPPGSTPPSGGSSTPPPPPADPLPPSSGGCTGSDPFASMATLKGLCVNGGWTPVPR